MTVIGIDLGTTNSLVAVMGEDGPRTLENEFGDHLTPSAVAVASDGKVLVGRAARDRLMTDPASGRAFFKRDMGTATTYQFGGRTWSPAECSAQVLREMKRVAEIHLKETVTRAVISVPAYFHDSQRQATISAATIAGLTIERIINEPTAAALAFGYRNRDRECKLLVFDLGGGTFDVTVLEVFDGVIEVKASGGESRLGGEDYTDALLDHVIATAKLTCTDKERARLRQVVEVAKRKLATCETATMPLPARPGSATGLPDSVFTITRADFSSVTTALTARIRPVVKRCLRDARVEAKELDDVLLVGGASRMPMVGEFIAAELATPGNRTLDPDRVVALGAAVQAALCERSEAVQDLVLTDVCPHTLGVEVSKEFAGDEKSGFFSPIIDRNSTVPISRVHRYSTMHPRQDQVRLRVFQGEGRLTAENTLLGTLVVDGLRHRPGQEDPGAFDVRFTYDMNGILEVEATVCHSKFKATKVIESRPGALNAEEIAAAIRRLQPLKTHPRDLLPNRARVERAQRLFPELNGAARAELTSRLDDFEAALATQDAKEIATMAAILDSFLQHFYADEGERQPPDPQPDPKPVGGA